MDRLTPAFRLKAEATLTLDWRARDSILRKRGQAEATLR
jgi:hypothetical protein